MRAPKRHSPGPSCRSRHLRAIGFSGRCSTKKMTRPAPATGSYRLPLPTGTSGHGRRGGGGRVVVAATDAPPPAVPGPAQWACHLPRSVTTMAFPLLRICARSPSMNCGQRDQMHHYLCAYLSVRGGHGGAFLPGHRRRWTPPFVVGRTVARGGYLSFTARARSR